MHTSAFKPILALVLIGWALPAATAHAQAACDEILLSQAGQSYDLGRFDETVSALRPCLPGRHKRGEKHFRRKQAPQALRLMALSYYAQQAPPDSTRDWVREIVKLNPRYQTAPDEDPLFFQHLVEELRPPRFYQRRWVQIGGALVVGAVVSYVLLKPEPESLPHPGDVFGPPGN